MIVDGRRLDAGTGLTADVCVIGAGPAGIALSIELDRRGIGVCLLESGGLDLDRDSDALNELVAGEGNLAVPNGTRRRQFGGTSNMWQVRLRKMSTGARYLPLTVADFEERDWIPDSGWPFGRTELDPHYRRAHAVCGLGPYEHDPAAWSDERAPVLRLDEARVITSIEHFGQGDVFTHRSREVLDRSTTARVVLHSTATQLSRIAGSRAIEHLDVACFGGHHFTVSAKIYVVASGAIETARLLLLSDRTAAGGLGNENDLVGRYFMDHLWMSSGRLVPRDKTLFNRMGMYDLRTVRGSTVRAKLVLADELKRQNRLANSALELLPKPQSEIYTAVRSLRELTRALRNRERPSDMGTKLRSMVPAGRYILGTGTRLAINQRRIPPSVDAGWSDLPRNDRRFESLEAIQQIELTPEPDNRVKLSDSLDELGQRKACVDWRLSDFDARSARRSQELFAEEFARSGVGTLELPDPAEAPVILSPAGIYHQLGTTRMHDDPAKGVVNRNCRVHDVPNLYIAGGATFPTGGYANCTLTIVALALRLADHLADHLTSRIVADPSRGQE